MTEPRIKAAIGLFILALLFFLIFVKDDTVGRLFFYVGALLAIHQLVRDRNIRARIAHPAALAGLILIAYMGLSALWGTNSEVANYLLQALALVLFWLALVTACQVPDHYLYRFANGLLLIVALGALYAVISYFLFGEMLRNRGPNLLHHYILGPSILIACAATGVMLRQHLRRPDIRLTLGLFMLLAAYVLTTRSRGPMLGLTVWILVMFLLDRRDLRRNAWIFGGLAVTVVVFCLVEPQYVQRLIERGDTYRFLIWENTLAMLPDHLWFGRGINFDFLHAPVQQVLKPAIGFAIYHPHNLGLATALYGGLAGLALLALTSLSALVGVLRGDRRGFGYALPMVAAVFALTLTDTNKLIAEPSSAIWFIFWLPSACLAGLALRVTQDGLFKPQDGSRCGT